MTTIVGGLRARLIRDSAYAWIREGLEALGWDDAGRRHLPIVWREGDVDFDEKIEFNTISLSQTDVIDEDAELGSSLTNDTWTFYVDFFAENDSVGTHFIHDVRDILRGKMPAIGRGRPTFDVYDYSLATPVIIAVCDVERVTVDRANNFPRPWQKHWYVCRFDVVDTYASSAD